MTGPGGSGYFRVWIALSLFCLLAGSAWAADFDSPEPSPPSEAVPDNAITDNAARSPGEWVDRTHAYLVDRIDDTVVWFDDFFGQTRSMDTARPEFTLRWTNEMRAEEGNVPKFRTSVRANLRLPKLTRKLKLVISGENKPDPTAVLPSDPGNPGFDPEVPGTSIKQVNTELRYEFLQNERNYFFAGAGVRLTLPFEVFARVRYQYNRPVGEDNYFRFALTPFWKNEDGFGETTEFSLEHRIRPGVLVGWANSGTVSEITPGLEWGTAFFLAARLSPRSAVSPSVGMTGQTRPHTVVSSYRVGTKYRRNDFRPWFFWELEPEVNWPRDDRGSRKPVWAATLRVEILFLGR
jgi:hypothetical protein